MQERVYKYRLKVTKQAELRFISHLDWQGLILKIFRRLELPLVLSQGFNKMPKVAFSPALPIFIESDCEMINFQVQKKLDENFIEKFEKNSPNGLKLISIKELDEKTTQQEPKSLENYVQWAKYEAQLQKEKNHVYNIEKISYIIEKCLSSGELLITKKTKKGIEKTINYRNSLKSFEILDDEKMVFVLKAGQNEKIPSLRADEFLKALFGTYDIFKIKRIAFFDTDLRVI